MRDRGNVATQEKNEVTELLRGAVPVRVPTPRDEFRWRSWTSFEHALERHLARRQARIRGLARQR